jgi:heat shock protein HslJ
MHPNLLVILLISAAALLAGCQANGQPAGPATPLAGTEWTLVELNGQPFKAIEGLRTPTLALDQTTHRAAGSSGINRYSGSFELDGAHLKFGAMAGTRMAGPKAAMNYETDFLNAMSSVTAWRIDGSSLVLMNDTLPVARFTSAAAVPPRSSAPPHMGY